MSKRSIKPKPVPTTTTTGVSHGLPWRVTISTPHVVVCPDGVSRYDIMHDRMGAEAVVDRIRRTKRCSVDPCSSSDRGCPDPEGLHTVEQQSAYAERKLAEMTGAVKRVKKGFDPMKEDTMAAKATATKKKAVKKSAKSARVASVPEPAPAPSTPEQPPLQPPPPPFPDGRVVDAATGRVLPEMLELARLRSKLVSGTEEERAAAYDRLVEIEQRRRVRELNDRVFTNAVSSATAATVGRVEGNLLALTKVLTDEAALRDAKKLLKKQRVRIVISGGGLDVDVKAANVKEAAKRLRRVLARIDEFEKPEDKRTLTLQFNEIEIQPGKTGVLSAQVQCPFKCERFIMRGVATNKQEALVDLSVEDIRVGGESMFNSADGLGVVPATAYSVDARDVGTVWRLARRGEYVTIKVKNNGKLPIVVSGASFGHGQVSYREWE